MLRAGLDGCADGRADGRLTTDSLQITRAGEQVQVGGQRTVMDTPWPVAGRGEAVSGLVLHADTVLTHLELRMHTYLGASRISCAVLQFLHATPLT